MRAGHYEIQVLQEDGRPLPEVKHDGERYVVGKPGKAFKVSVTCTDYKGKLSPLLKSDREHFSAFLAIDGVDCGVCFPLSDGASVLFQGFVLAGRKDEHIRYREFLFAKPVQGEQGEKKQDTTDQGTKVGRIVVQIKHQTYTDSKQLDVSSSLPHTASVSAAEGKKFYHAPSLAAQPGKEVTTQLTWSGNTSTDIAIAHTTELRYETAATLLLRNILNPSDPRHAAIIQEDLQAASVAVAAGRVPRPSLTPALSDAKVNLKGLEKRPMLKGSAFNPFSLQEPKRSAPTSGRITKKFVVTDRGQKQSAPTSGKTNKKPDDTSRGQKRPSPLLRKINVKSEEACRFPNHWETSVSCQGKLRPPPLISRFNMRSEHEDASRGQQRHRAILKEETEVIDLTASPCSDKPPGLIPRPAKKGKVLTCDLTAKPRQQSWSTQKNGYCLKESDIFL